MATDYNRARRFIERLRDLRAGEDLSQIDIPPEHDLSPRVANTARIDPAAVERRWALLQHAAKARPQLLDDHTAAQMAEYGRNIENFIGAARIPIGLAGPLRVHGLFARGDYYVPLATTEAALVASYTRGAQALSEAGGCISVVINEGVSRSPVFIFDSLRDSGRFVLWVTEQIDALRREVESTTSHGRLMDFRISMEGNSVYLLLEFTTGDAAGQNMVTIATDAACRFLVEHTPIKPRRWYVEGNMSSDKKASALSLQTVRGKKVIAEGVIPAELLRRRLHCSAAEMEAYYHASALGGVLSGNIGIQGHIANGLAAVFIACGQDAACVAEAAVGVTRLEEAPEGALYASVTLPNLIVGTVGGGTALPSQRACLEILGLAGPGHANAFAEVCAALVLAGEISIIAALAGGHFTRAHRKLARGGQP